MNKRVRSQGSIYNTFVKSRELSSLWTKGWGESRILLLKKSRYKNEYVSNLFLCHTCSIKDML